jgi:hypothetical protein
MLETQEVHIALEEPSNNGRGITGLWWLALPFDEVSRSDSVHLQEFSDDSTDRSNGKNSTLQVLPSLPIICRQHSSLHLSFFAFGISHIASLPQVAKLQDIFLTSNNIDSRQIDQNIIAIFDVVRHFQLGCIISFQPSFSELVYKLQRLTIVQNKLSHCCRKVDEHVTNMNKRWRECTKTIPLKLSLLKTLIEGYQLNLTCVEFLHSVAMCGLWHPAATASFSQHWNDQGITRLRSGIDSTSRLIIRTLQLKLAPLATNMYQLARYVKTDFVWLS